MLCSLINAMCYRGWNSINICDVVIALFSFSKDFKLALQTNIAARVILFSLVEHIYNRTVVVIFIVLEFQVIFQLSDPVCGIFFVLTLKAHRPPISLRLHCDSDFAKIPLNVSSVCMQEVWNSSACQIRCRYCGSWSNCLEINGNYY